MLSGGDCNATPALRVQNYLQRRKRMTFEIHSDITNRSMTVASRAMRKVLRRKRSILGPFSAGASFYSTLCC